LLVDGDDCVEGEIQEWVEVAAGAYTIGSPPGESNRFDDERLHEVKLSRGFRVRSTEVTQGEFQKIMGYNPSRFSDCGERCPVERVSWHEAALYANTLSERSGLEPCYTCRGAAPDSRCVLGNEYQSPYECPGFRLPTEAEWEIAARAGNPGPRYGSEVVRIAWYRANSGGTTRRVASREPNGWGVFDIFGNVMEWCNDWYGEYSTSDIADPSGPIRGTIRALRGGSWLINAERVRAAYRYRFPPNTRLSYVGFRVVQTLGMANREQGAGNGE
jgi:formylglycine-generating enzyme required for sulfatase activity